MKSEIIKNFLHKNQIYPYQLESLVEEGSNRVYYRIFYNENQSLILCVTYPFIPERDDFLELSYYLKNHNLKVPRIIDYSAGEGLILLEDGGSQSLQDVILEFKKNGDKEKIKNFYISILDEISRWHSLKDIPDFVKNRYFNFEKLDFEINFLYEKMKIIKDMPRPGFEFNVFLKEVNEFLSSQNLWVFTHRDFHSRNILYKNSEEDSSNDFFVIDFQDARMGLPWYDVSSLLYDPYVFLDHKLIFELFDYYYKKNHYPQKEKDYHRNVFYLQSLQRLLKALGSFFYLGLEKNKKHFLEAIPQTLEHLIHISIAGKFPDHLYLYFNNLKKFINLFYEAQK